MKIRTLIRFCVVVTVLGLLLALSTCVTAYHGGVESKHRHAKPSTNPWYH